MVALRFFVMKRGTLWLKKPVILITLFSVVLFTCGFDFKVKSIYPTPTPRNDERNISGEEQTSEEEYVREDPDISEENVRTVEEDAISVPSEVIEDNGANIYLVGDSRTVYAWVDLKDQRANWLAACGTSYSHFAQNYIPILDGADLSGRKIVILFGVNDIGYYGKETAIANWIGFYKTKAQEWIKRGASVYACSVLGFNYRAEYNGSGCSRSDIVRMNQNVDEYNALMESLLPSNINYLRLGFSTEEPLRDGVHYSFEEDRRIYGGIIDMLAQ